MSGRFGRAPLCVLVALAMAQAGHGAPHLLGKSEPQVGKPAPRFSARRAQLAPRTLNSTAPATVRVLFLRVDFPPDTTITTSGTGEWSDCMAACNDDPDYWVRKNATDLAAYYQEVSRGRLQLSIDVFPNGTGTAYRLPQPMAFYGQSAFDQTSIEALIRDSVTLADGDVDFGNYDAVLIVHAGAGEESDIANESGDSPDDLWSLYYGGDGAVATPDGASITEAIIMPQTGSQDGIVMDPLGVYAHEFGHWLGLPDLYPVVLASGGWKGIGQWGLMGDGAYNRASETDVIGSTPAHLSAWSKLDLGWVTATEIPTHPDAAAAYQLAPVASGGEVLRMRASPHFPERFFLVENRRRQGFDSALPGEGLLVWLVDQDVIDTQRASNQVNSSMFTPGVRLVEADGDAGLMQPFDDGGDYGSAGDPFPGTQGNTALSPQSLPSSATFASPAWVNLKDIADDGTTISFVAGYSPVPPSALNATPASCGIDLSWTSDTALDFDGYRVYFNGALLGATVATTFHSNENPGGIYRVTAVDVNGYESHFAESAGVAESPSCSGKDSRCFVATAAFGSPLAREVDALRAFRDAYLMTNAPGRWFVKGYYAMSPPVADFIRHRPRWRAAVRVALRPLVALSRHLTT